MSSTLGNNSGFSRKIRPIARLAPGWLIGNAQQWVTNLYAVGVVSASGWQLFARQMSGELTQADLKRERRRIENKFVSATDANWARKERLKRIIAP